MAAIKMKARATMTTNASARLPKTPALGFAPWAGMERMKMMMGNTAMTPITAKSARKLATLTPIQRHVRGAVRRAIGGGYEVGAGGDEVHENQLHAGAEVEEQEADGEEDEAEYGDENKSDGTAGYGAYAGG